MVKRFIGVVLFIALTFGVVWASTTDLNFTGSIEENEEVSTSTSGTHWTSNNELMLEPTSATTLTAAAVRGYTQANHTSKLHGDGHYIGVIGYCDIQASSSNVGEEFPFCIGTEGWFRNESGNNVVNAAGLFSHLSGNKSGTITNSIGLGIGINGNSGTLHNAIGVSFSMDGAAFPGESNAGNVTNIFGMIVSPMTEPSGTGAYSNITGFYFSNQTATFSGNKYAFHNADDDALIESESTVESTATTNGSFHTKGGVGIEKTLRVGGSIYASDGLTFALGANLTNHTDNPGIWDSTIIMAKGKPAYYWAGPIPAAGWYYMDDTAVTW